MQYRRIKQNGGCYFFTVNLENRQQNLLTENINILRQSVRSVKQKHPFIIDAMVILPDHIHCIWTMPEHDTDYALRWSLIKSGFSRVLPVTEKINPSRQKRGERGIWQRRFWEHLIRDDCDFEKHVDYIHFNPVKHGYVKNPVDWPYSSIHRFIKNGLLVSNWAGDVEDCVGDFGEFRD